ncbi:adenylate kinase [Flintibacter muris]|uniref:adenylate kinase n=1 Tax=Flintibacter muris TaxID=2941327 RepID=UPI00203BC2B6|nr:adenylate kinase [Flintibacter muris]
MKRIIVIGSPGAGKSTLARRLRDITGIPLYYLDMLWHKADGTHVSKEEFDIRLNEVVQKNRWIIDGNYQRTLKFRLQACDTVFLLDFPLNICLAGAEARIGQAREDLPWLETEFDPEFRQWIVDFPKNELPQIYELLEYHGGGKNIVVLKSRKEADDYLKALC